MKIQDINDPSNQVANALDFTLSSLVGDFNRNVSYQDNIMEFVRVTMDSIAEHQSIPYVSIKFNGVQLMENQRVYSFVGSDFFETASVEDCDNAVNHILLFITQAQNTIRRIREDVKQEIREQISGDEIHHLDRMADMIKFKMSDYSKTFCGSFVRLLLMRSEQQYSDAFYQDKTLNVEITTMPDGTLSIRHH